MTEENALIKTRWTLEELYAAKFPPRKWIIDGLIYPGVSTQFFGAGKIGKTHLMLDLALHVAYSEPDFLGLSIKKSGPVLYYMLEEEAQDLMPILQAHPLANLNFYPESMDGQFEIETQLSLSNKEDWSRLKESCFGHILVVLDSLTSLQTRLNKSKPEDAKQIVIGLNEIARETRCAIVFINHARKPTFVEDTLGHKASDEYEIAGTNKGAGELFDLSGGTFKLTTRSNNPRLIIQPRHAGTRIIHLKKVFRGNEPWWIATQSRSFQKKSSQKMELFDQISVDVE